MRTLTLTAATLSLLALFAVGCADESGAERRPFHDRPTSSTTTNAPTGTTAAAVTVNGHVDGLDGASQVEVNAMNADGSLTPVGTADVKDGQFTTTVAPDQSPTGIFIMKVQDIGGALLGSGVINGIPAFTKGITIDAAVDVVTSFKSEILTTMAQKNVPGVQNYLNVIDAFVNQELAANVEFAGVAATDINTDVGVISDAIIAAGDVIVDALNKAGIPVDDTALKNAQTTAVSGFQGFVTSSSGQLISSSKNLVASLEAASANAAAPIDTAIFNAIVNGGATFSSKAKDGAPANPKLAFAAQKSAFSMETALTTSSITSQDSSDPVAKACADFTAAVQAATSLGDLEAAKTAITNILMPPAAGATDPLTGLLNTLKNDLVAAFKSLNLDQIADALAKVDASDLPNSVRLIQKQIVQ